MDKFRHEALLYKGTDDFVQQTVPFIREGIDAGEPTLVVVSAEKAERLREAVGPGVERVRFADMDEVGRNPARIIPAWRDFVDEHAHSATPLRGIGEPIWLGRAPNELVECQEHEALLNVAFDDGPPWQLVCPYDVEELPQEVIDEAFRTHPYVAAHGVAEASASYLAAHPFTRPLPEPGGAETSLVFALDSLEGVRNLVSRTAAGNLDPSRVDDLVLATNEIATNSLRYGGGGGMLRIWNDPDRIVCEVRDDGRITDPLAGRVRPDPGQEGGYGLWIANQLCDLVQIRVGDAGTIVRLHMLTS